MYILQILFLTTAAVILKNTEAGSSYKRVCYYTNWSQYRRGAGHFTPKNIQADLCTHIIFAFAKLAGNDIATIEPNDKQLYRELNGLKSQKPDLKITIAIGGWNAGSASFSKMASVQSTRESFIQNTIKFLRDNNLDGLDIDWEYPAKRGGVPQDKQNFALLTKELRTAFEQESTNTGKDRLLLSVAVPAGKSSVDSGYDVRTVAQNVDFINLMTYDLHGPWEGKAGETSPLYPKSSETGATAQLNTAWAANYWYKMGAPKDKIIVGISFFGKTYNLANAADHDIGAKIRGSGPTGKFTGENGVSAYYETCKMQEAGGDNYWENEQHVPYYVNGNLWVGYDNVRSVQDKSEFVKTEGFGGIMVWSVDGDDFGKICASSKTTFPLLRTIKDTLSDGTIVPDTTTVPTTQIPTTAQPTTKFKTTVQPTTSFPTTVQPTTSFPTTAQPSTNFPTTARPTTNFPTTVQPTTNFPTTVKPTTNFPTTVQPTTNFPTTVQPTTNFPTTVQPTTNLPTTVQPSTNFPTTVKPTTNLPTTVQPTTNFPTTVQPTTNIPTTVQPTTNIPTTVQPTTNIPTTSPPSPSSSMPPMTTKSPIAIPTKVPPKKAAKFACTSRQDGFYSDPISCSSFHRCVGGRDFRFACPVGTVYNSKIHVCDWPHNVRCAGQP